MTESRHNLKEKSTPFSLRTVAACALLGAMIAGLWGNAANASPVEHSFIDQSAIGGLLGAIAGIVGKLTHLF